MLVGKLCPDISICRSCLDNQICYGFVKDCNKCLNNNKECQIISTGSSFWSGDYAVVLLDGQMKKISMSRLHDIREE